MLSLMMMVVVVMVTMFLLFKSASMFAGSLRRRVRDLDSRAARQVNIDIAIGVACSLIMAGGDTTKRVFVKVL